MADAAGTLETLGLELGRALKPLTELLGPEIFVRLGVDLPNSVTGDGNLNARLNSARTKAGELDTKINDLAAVIDGNNPANIIASGIALIAKIAELITALHDVGTALNTAANALPPADRGPIQQFAATMAVRSLEFMSIGYLDEKLPNLTDTLTVLGLADKEHVMPPELEVSDVPRVIVPRRFYVDRIPKLLSNPA